MIMWWEIWKKKTKNKKQKKTKNTLTQAMCKMSIYISVFHVVPSRQPWYSTSQHALPGGRACGGRASQPIVFLHTRNSDRRGKFGLFSYIAGWKSWSSCLKTLNETDTADFCSVKILVWYLYVLFTCKSEFETTVVGICTTNYNVINMLITS